MISQASYPHAVITPFSKKAEQAQVPDCYSFPTETQYFKTSTTVSSDASGAFDFSIQPNFYTTVYTNNGNSITDLTVSTVVNSLSGGLTPQAQTYSLLLDTTVYNKYRIVGFGARFRSQMIPLSATGTIYMSSLPTNDFIPTYNWWNQASNRAAVCALNDMPNVSSTGYFNPIMQSLPTGEVIEAYEFNSNGVEWASRVTSPEAYKWRAGGAFQKPVGTDAGSANTYFGEASGQANIGTLLGSPATGQYTPSIAPFTFYGNGGWSNWNVTGVGMPESSVIGILEIIMHIEYVPATEQLYSSGKFPPVNTDQLMKTADRAASLPLYRSIQGLFEETENKMRSRLGFE